jgi:hypothetical protein
VYRAGPVPPGTGSNRTGSHRFCEPCSQRPKYTRYRHGAYSRRRQPDPRGARAAESFAAAMLPLRPAACLSPSLPSRSVPKKLLFKRTSKLRLCGSWRAKVTGIVISQSIANSPANADGGGDWRHAGVRGRAGGLHINFLSRLPNWRRQRAEGRTSRRSTFPAGSALVKRTHPSFVPNHGSAIFDSSLLSFRYHHKFFFKAARVHVVVVVHASASSPAAR